MSYPIKYISNFKVLITLFLVSIFLSCKEDTGFTNENNSPIQKERIIMHEKFVKTVESLQLEKKLERLSKKSFNESTQKEAEDRIQYAWRIGDVDQLKEDIPLYLNSKNLNGEYNFRSDWNLIIHMWEYAPSEWARFDKMIDELYIYFKETGKIVAEQKMLGAKIQSAHLMGDRGDERKFLLQMLKELDSDDERYDFYAPMLGWWCQDQGLWKESIVIFNKQYEKLKSGNMLSSLIWGLFNDAQYEKVLEYEDEILKIKGFKVYYILAKSYQELGNEIQAKKYYEKFSKNNFIGSDVDFYFTDRNDNKFYEYDDSYLIKVADYFSTIDPAYSCKLNENIYKMIKSALNSEYAASLDRKVILAQERYELQQLQYKKYQSKRKFLFNELKVLKSKCEECD